MKALQLSDEQRRTKRLHDTLCRVQAELFNGSGAARGRRRYSGRRPEALTPTASHTQLVTPDREPAQPPLLRCSHSPSMPPPDERQEQEEQPPPAVPPVGSRTSGGALRSTVERVEAELGRLQAVEQSLSDFEQQQQQRLRQQQQQQEQFLHEPSVHDFAAETYMERTPRRGVLTEPAQNVNAMPDDDRVESDCAGILQPSAAPDAGAGPHMGHHWATRRSEGGMAPVGSLGQMVGSGQSPVPSTTPTARDKLMMLEERLRDILEATQFESLVVRLGSGLYQFGPSVRACVRLREDNQVYASKDGVDYEPVESFIAKITNAEAAKAPRSGSQPPPERLGHGKRAVDTSWSAATGSSATPATHHVGARQEGPYDIEVHQGHATTRKRGRMRQLVLRPSMRRMLLRAARSGQCRQGHRRYRVWWARESAPQSAPRCHGRGTCRRPTTLRGTASLRQTAGSRPARLHP